MIIVRMLLAFCASQFPSRFVWGRIDTSNAFFQMLLHRWSLILRLVMVVLLCEIVIMIFSKNFDTIVQMAPMGVGTVWRLVMGIVYGAMLLNYPFIFALIVLWSIQKIRDEYLSPEAIESLRLTGLPVRDIIGSPVCLMAGLTLFTFLSFSGVQYFVEFLQAYVDFGWSPYTQSHAIFPLAAVVMYYLIARMCIDAFTINHLRNKWGLSTAVWLRIIFVAYGCPLLGYFFLTFGIMVLYIVFSELNLYMVDSYFVLEVIALLVSLVVTWFFCHLNNRVTARQFNELIAHIENQ